MRRTNIIQLKPNKLQKKILKELLLLSSCVYNETNYVVRQQFFNKEKISSFYDLQQKLQNIENYKLLGRVYALPRIQIYSETISSRFKLIKSKTQKYVNLPKYYKNRKTNTTLLSYIVMDNCQYSIKENYVIIPLSRKMRKKYGIKHFKIKYNGTLKWKGLQKRGQVRLKGNKFYLHQSVELKEKSKVKSNIKAGLDIGIKKLLSVYINNGESRTIGSKRFSKQWGYYTNLISKEQSELMLQNKKTSKNLQRLYEKRNKWQNNLYNKLIARLFRLLKRSNVSYLAIGNLKNIRDSKNRKGKLNQMVHNYWSFDLLLEKIRNKAEEFGIEINKISEYYTSRTCPICGAVNKQGYRDEMFTCSFCNYKEHRDIVGARNNLFKSLYGSLQSIQRNETIPLEAK